MRQISQLIQELDTYQRPDEIKLGITKAIEFVKYTVEKLTTNENTTGHSSQTLLNRLQFILCQLEYLDITKIRRRYNVLTLTSLKAQLISACNRYLQSLDCLCLPYLSTLRRLYSNIGLDTDFVDYLKVECQNFDKFKRHVVLQFDEIHVQCALSTSSLGSINTQRYLYFQREKQNF